MRVIPSAHVTITDGTDQRDVLFQPDAALAEVNLDGFREQVSGRENLAALDTFTLPIGDLTNPAGLFLRFTGDFAVNINGLGDINIRRGAAKVGSAAVPLPDTPGNAARLLMEAQVTTVVVTAVGAGVLIWAAWGDVDPTTP